MEPYTNQQRVAKAAKDGYETDTSETSQQPVPVKSSLIPHWMNQPVRFHSNLHVLHPRWQLRIWKREAWCEPGYVPAPIIIDAVDEPVSDDDDYAKIPKVKRRRRAEFADEEKRQQQTQHGNASNEDAGCLSGGSCEALPTKGAPPSYECGKPAGIPVALPVSSDGTSDYQTDGCDKGDQCLQPTGSDNDTNESR